MCPMFPIHVPTGRDRLSGLRIPLTLWSPGLTVGLLQRGPGQRAVGVRGVRAGRRAHQAARSLAAGDVGQPVRRRCRV